MKRSQKKFMQQLQARMNAFVIELATITKMLQMCSDPDCTSGCSLGEVELCSDPDCTSGCKMDKITSCSDPDCTSGCKLDQVKTCSDPDCTSGCSLGEIELCSDPDCTSGCKGGHGHAHGGCTCGCHKEEAQVMCGGDDGDDDDCDCGCHEHHHCDCGCECDDEECECGCHEGKCCEDDDCDCDCHEHHCDCGCECDDDCDCGCHEHHCDCGCEDEACDCCGVEMDYLNLAKQIQADFDNYRRRNKEAISIAMFEGTKNAISDFLPILDTVNKAISLVVDDNARHGLELIKENFENALQKLGVTPILALGEHYDPNLHNVVLSEESDKESGTIIEELEKGYMYKGVVLKHSIVKIAK